MTNVIKFYDRKLYDQNVEDAELQYELNEASHTAMRLMSSINALEVQRLEKFSIRQCEKIILEIADDMDQLNSFYQAWLKSN